MTSILKRDPESRPPNEATSVFIGTSGRKIERKSNSTELEHGGGTKIHVAGRGPVQKPC